MIFVELCHDISRWCSLISRSFWACNPPVQVGPAFARPYLRVSVNQQAVFKGEGPAAKDPDTAGSHGKIYGTTFIQFDVLCYEVRNDSFKDNLTRIPFPNFDIIWWLFWLPFKIAKLLENVMEKKNRIQQQQGMRMEYSATF